MLEKIEKLCEERGITIFSLERTLGFGRCTISKWRNSSPSVENLKKVADYLGVSIDSLLEEGKG